ncbi:hypothetical protein [Algiphilus sp.]|uniref:hypothetical protein n=1 Tax=Algiphilus sp. TaxID=1872431 RepID=UPI0032F03CC0
MNELLKSKIDELKDNPASPAYRIVAGFIISLIFTSYPIFIFVVYMWKNGFYSYDVIGESFSLSVFFYANLLLLGVVSLFLLGSITTTAISWKTLKNNKNPVERPLAQAVKSNAFPILGNVLAIALLSIASLKGENAKLFIFLGVVSILLISLITALAVASAGTYCKIAVAVIGLMYILPLIWPDEATNLLADGLKFFRVGNTIVSLHSSDIDSPLELKGELVFLSPEYAYIKAGEDSLKIVPRRESLTILYHPKKR